jgi:hypothetical protein
MAAISLIREVSTDSTGAGYGDCSTAQLISSHRPAMIASGFSERPANRSIWDKTWVDIMADLV